MDITYLGHSSFRIRGKNASVVIDPYDSAMVGLKFPKHIATDILLVTHDHPDHNAVSQIDGEPFVVRGPGEYEIKGVEIIGIPVYHDAQKGQERGTNTMYRIEIDGVSIVHAGDLGHTLSTGEVDGLDGVNILMIPVGGVYTISAAQAAQVIKEIEPSVVIPMHYGKPELVKQTFGQLATLADFLKEMGKEGTPAQSKLTITKDKIPEEMQVVVLE